MNSCKHKSEKQGSIYQSSTNSIPWISVLLLPTSKFLRKTRELQYVKDCMALERSRLGASARYGGQHAEWKGKSSWRTTETQLTFHWTLPTRESFFHIEAQEDLGSGIPKVMLRTQAILRPDLYAWDGLKAPSSACCSLP